METNAFGARQKSVAREGKFAVSLDSRSQEGLLGIVATRVFVVLGPQRRGEFYELRVPYDRSRRGRSLQLQASDLAAERGRTASSTPLG